MQENFDKQRFVSTAINDCLLKFSFQFFFSTSNDKRMFWIKIEFN